MFLKVRGRPPLGGGGGGGGGVEAGIWFPVQFAVSVVMESLCDIGDLFVGIETVRNSVDSNGGESSGNFLRQSTVDIKFDMKRAKKYIKKTLH